MTQQRPAPSTPAADEPAAPARRRGAVGASILAMVTVAALGAAAVFHQPLLAAAGLRGQPLPTAPRTLFVAPSTTSSAQPSTVGTMPPPAPASPDDPADPATVAARVNAVPKRFGGTAAVMVLDSASGRVLHQANQNTPLIPASNMKTLTSVGALATIDPDHRFRTAVTSPASGVIVLRGGGDPYLRSVPDPGRPWLASLQILAERTAAELKRQGRSSVQLGVDSSLFAGPDWAPSWPTGYVDQVTPIQALMVDGGRTLAPDGTVKDGTRTKTPALAAGAVFAGQLKARGVTVTGPITARAAGSAAPVASVDSAPLEQLVTDMMIASDNTAAETILRHVALAAGRPGSFAEGTRALQRELEKLKIWQPGARLLDGSGLSRDNRVTASMLARAWQVIATTPHLRAVLTATPVAGVSGTLRERFLVDESLGGRGRVHAKTGTLSEVSSLSGWTTTRSGQSLIMVLMVNGSTDDWWARAWIDTVAGRLSECGC